MDPAHPQRPRISVVMPVYNGMRYLAASLESIACQSHPVHEVIVIDDGSTDRTREIIKNWESRLPLVAVFQPHRGNWVASTNVAIAKVTGTHFSMLHQDDLWDPRRVEVLSDVIATRPGADVVIHPTRFIGPDGRWAGTWNCPFSGRGRPLDRQEVLSHLLVQNFLAVPAPLIARRALDSTAALDEKLWFTADWKFWLGLALRGNWVFEPRPLASFRVHRSSLTMRGGRTAADYEQQLRAVIDEFSGFSGSTCARAVIDFNLHVNTAMFAALKTGKLNVGRLVLDFIGLGPDGWRLFFRASRIHERIMARVVARVVSLVTSRMEAR